LTENTEIFDDSFIKIGVSLRQARNSSGLTVQDVSRELRISLTYLKNLEDGKFDELPAPAYVSGFIRSYGRFVGLDGEEMVARYRRLNSKELIQNYKNPMSTRPPQTPSAAIASSIVVIAAIAYGGWYWMGDNSHSDNATSTIVTAANSPLAQQEMVGEVDPEIMREPEITPELETVAETEIAPEPETVVDVVPGPVTPAPNMPVEVATKTPIAEIPIAKVPAKAGDAIANLRVPEKEITIRAVATSWVEIVRDNGEGVMAQLMRAGDSYVVDGASRLYLSTGNAGGLTVIIGQGTPLPLGVVGEIVRDLPLVPDKLKQNL